MNRSVRNRRSVRSSGLTLVELLVTLAIMSLMAVAISGAFVAGIDAERSHRATQNTQEQIAAVEQELTQTLEGAILSSAANDRTTYFIGDNVGDTLAPLPQNGTAAGGATNAPTNTLDNAGASDTQTLPGCTRLTFTSVAPAAPLRIRNVSDDFETQQQNYGPLGGTAEVEWATTAQGEAGDRTGLFQRIQRPSDGDPGQGGRESVLSPLIDAISFQFWDGVQWTETWNTVTGLQKRLPAAVLVSYRLTGETSDVTHSFVVPIPNSDVTALNPLTTSTGAAQ